MAQLVCAGATLMCTGGLAPSSLVVAPANRVFAGGPPAANIMDNKPMVNIMPFGMCNMPSNPAVAAATAAKAGVFTPAACIPATVAPWAPGSPTVLIGGMPALSNTCTLTCMWGGVISVTAPGQFTVQVA